MNLNEVTDVIYQYIVQKQSMEKIADYMGYGDGNPKAGISIVSEILEEANFNPDKKTRNNNFGGGRDLGRYAPGRPAARGLRITHDMIYDYLCDIDYWGNFDNYVADIADEKRAEREQQQMQEQQRREQQERQRQLEEQRRREQAARDAEFKRIQAQEEARKAAEKAAKEREYPRYIEQGLRYLKADDIRNAYDAFINAQKCKDTYEARKYIAETIANSGNPGSHSDTIIEYLECYSEFLAKSNKKLSPEHMLHLARAYRSKNNLGTSCYYFLLAGEHYYLAKDYAKADAIYTENDKENNRYNRDIVDCAFRMAYSRSKKENMTNADHQYCIKWYTVAIDLGQQTGYAYGNRSHHNRMLGDSYEAVDDAREALSYGIHEKYVYNNLLKAQVDNYDDYDDLTETMDEMDAYGYSYDPWYRGVAIERSYDHEDEEALPYYRQQIKIDPNHAESLNYLMFYETDNRLATEYGFRRLALADDNADEKWLCEAVYYKARSTGDPELIEKALKWYPEARADYEAEKKQHEEYERRVREEEARLAQERARLEAEAEAARIAEEQRLAQERRLEAERRLAEEARLAQERRLEEERRLAEEARIRREKEEEELLLTVLF